MLVVRKIKRICWVIAIPLAVILVYLGSVYYSFYKDVQQVKDSNLRPPFDGGPLVAPFFNNEYVSTWGAFGDFIGGTFNPIVGVLSVVLLFLTWIVTRQTLESTMTELSESSKAFKATADAQKEIQRTQSLQQFDTIFFSMLNNLNAVHLSLQEINAAKKESELDKRYRECFGDGDYGLTERQEFIDDSHQLRKYFIILYQIIKNIKNNIHSNSNFDEKEKRRLARLYANMLRSNLDNKILQLLLLNIYKRFDSYSELLREYRFFEHMDFRNHDGKIYWNFSLLQVSKEMGQQYFYSSDWYKELKENKILKSIFLWGDDFYNVNLFSKKYLSNFLDKNIKIYYTNSVVLIRFGSDSLNLNNLRISFLQDSSRVLNTEIDIFRDKFLLKKDKLYYQLNVEQDKLFISTSDHKIKNYLPISDLNIEVTIKNPL
ncbi:MAG TPA: putative phage abortive infection protein [Acinetobacter pseudolwoffii]|nr:putative phage abortive infection protein [Acinetobacter pseudolwoffii]